MEVSCYFKLCTVLYRHTLLTGADRYCFRTVRVDVGWITEYWSTMTVAVQLFGMFILAPYSRWIFLCQTQHPPSPPSPPHTPSIRASLHNEMLVKRSWILFCLFLLLQERRQSYVFIGRSVRYFIKSCSSFFTLQAPVPQAAKRRLGQWPLFSLLEGKRFSTSFVL